MWLWVTTRCKTLVPDAQRKPVNVNDVSNEQAILLLRKATEFHRRAVAGRREGAIIVTLCDRRATNLAFEGTGAWFEKENTRELGWTRLPAFERRRNIEKASASDSNANTPAR